ncbi:MAG: AmmeMemoRadiSam system protein A [Mariprofundus sp.]|nr:AmmeMemoRadiSam system protein A [Mariprofundus sp.]
MSVDGVVSVGMARAAIAAQLSLVCDKVDVPVSMQQLGASFVTLHIKGELRGCIGTLEAYRPLAEDVVNNAVAAAFKDPRFLPLSVQEFLMTQIEVSLLSPLQALVFNNEQQALEMLKPGVDGVVLAFASYRATFLPQVWEQLPGKKEFMSHLKRKAGLAPDFFHSEMLLWRYSVTKFSEKNSAFKFVGGGC